jgi:hypothetical protein
MPKFNPRFLIDRTDADRVLLLAIPAAPQVTAVSFARFGVGHLVHIYTPAMHTARIRAPTLLLQKLDSG